MRSVDGRLTARAHAASSYRAALVTYDTLTGADYQLDPGDGREPIGLGASTGEAQLALLGLVRAAHVRAAEASERPR